MAASVSAVFRSALLSLSAFSLTFVVPAWSPGEAQAVQPSTQLCQHIYVRGQSVKMSVSHNGWRSDGSQDTYQIIYPDVAHAVAIYPEIKLAAGDRVRLAACGCAQTGGFGATWKDYVNPKGPKSDHLYSGMIGFIPEGNISEKYMQHPTDLVRIRKWIDRFGTTGFIIPGEAKTRTLLAIGYQDDGYGDNGYVGHDNGTSNQCRSMGTVAIDIVIDHRPLRPPPNK
jgi:hypothetical protein